MEVVDVAVCCTAFIMLCLCALVFAILRHFLTLSSHLIAETEFQIRKFFSSILPIKRNLLTHLDGLLVTSLTVGVFGQVFTLLCILG